MEPETVLPDVGRAQWAGGLGCGRGAGAMGGLGCGLGGCPFFCSLVFSALVDGNSSSHYSESGPESALTLPALGQVPRRLGYLQFIAPE